MDEYTHKQWRFVTKKHVSYTRNFGSAAAVETLGETPDRRCVCRFKV